jgi:hypothetical protein
VLFVAAPIPVHAQDSVDPVRAFTIHQTFQGSSSSYGQILKLNTNVGYEVGKHVGIDGGIPFYFVNNPSEEATSPGSISGFGNVYAALRVAFTGRLNYTSSITATAPTGNRDKGLSTGRVTVDWNNAVQKVIAHRIAPFANAGIANTVSDTTFFMRPFSSEGLVGHVDAGTTLSISPLVYVGASAYSILPSGEQTIVSKVVETYTETQPARTLPPNSGGRGVGLTKQTNRVFEVVREVVGTADLASDHGLSGWIGLGPVHGLNFTIGFSRSNHYGLNTVFWGVGKRFGPFGSNVR